jgi:hypothetical protein
MTAQSDLFMALLWSFLKNPGDNASHAALVDWLQEYPQFLAEAIQFLGERTLPRENDPDPTDPRFAATEFAVEANDFEILALWRDNEARRLQSIQWEQDQQGHILTLGWFGSEPVQIQCFWCRLNGHLVLFWNIVSPVHDHRMAERWLEKHCAPRYDNGTRLAHTDAMNFHACRSYCLESREDVQR